jgi:ribosome-associated protein
VTSSPVPAPVPSSPAPSASPAPSGAPARPPSVDSLTLARRIAALAAERRATDVVLLDVRSLVDYTDFFLLASGTSGRQNQTIAEHVVRTLKQDRLLAISKSGLDTGSWICLDLGDVVVHVFDPETRARYDLELLWADAPRADLAEPRASASPAADEPAASSAGDAASEGEAEDVPEAKKPARRRRAVRKAAVEDADAENAPAGARPPLDEPEPEEAKPAGRTAKAPKAAKPAKKRPAAKAAGTAPKAKGPAPKSAAKAPRPKKRRSAD